MDMDTSPAGNTDISSSTPTSQPDTSQPSSTPAAAGPQTQSPSLTETIPQQTPQQAPTAGQPNQPQSAGAKQPDLSKGPQQATPSAATTPQVHPAVQRASVIHQVATALAGGPRYTQNTDPNTGETTRTPVPMSKSDIGAAIALEAISGALSGLTQKGTGATGAAAEAGFQKVSQQEKEVQQQQAEQASADYSRKMQTVETNMRLRQNAMTLSKMDYDQHAEHVGQFKDMAEQFQHDHPEAVRGIANEGDLAKYDVTKDTAIPINVVPTLDPKTGKQAMVNGTPQWEEQYLIIDPAFKAGNFLTDDDKKTLAEMGKSGFADSKGNPTNLPQEIMMRSAMAINLKSQAASYRIAKQDIGSFYKSVGGKSPDLAAAVKDDQTLGDALLKFEPLLNATGRNYEKAIGELGAKDPQSAAKILSLYGGTDNVRKFDQTQTDADEQAKKTADRDAQFDTIDTEGKANAVLADPTKFSDDTVSAAHKFVQEQNNTKVGEAGSEARAREQATIDVDKANGIPLKGQKSGKLTEAINNPDIQGIKDDPNEQPVNGVRQGYFNQLNSIDPNVASLVKSLGEGRTVMSNYGLARGDGQVLASILTRAYPDYDQTKAPSYEKARASFTSGKDKTQVDGLNTAFMHVDRAYSNAGSELAVIPGNKIYADYQEDTGRLKEEINNAYTSGVLHDEERKSMSSRLDSTLPWVRKEAIKEVTKLMGDKATQMQRDWQRAKPSSAVPDFSLISPEAQSAFKNVTGIGIDQHGIVGGGSQSGSAGSGQSQFSHVSASGKFGWDGTKWVPTGK